MSESMRQSLNWHSQGKSKIGSLHWTTGIILWVWGFVIDMVFSCLVPASGLLLTYEKRNTRLTMRIKWIGWFVAKSHVPGRELLVISKNELSKVGNLFQDCEVWMVSEYPKIQTVMSTLGSRGTRIALSSQQPRLWREVCLTPNKTWHGGTYL